jgi:hypothetical protein
VLRSKEELKLQAEDMTFSVHQPGSIRYSARENCLSYPKMNRLAKTFTTPIEPTNTT